MNPLISPPSTQLEPAEKDILNDLQRTVSASRLGLFLQCRLKFYFRHVLRLQKPRTPALHVGTTVHAVLNTWNKARWLQQPLNLKQAHDAFMSSWADQPEVPMTWETGEEETEKTTGWRLVDTYLRESHVPAGLKPDAVEVPVQTDLSSQGLPVLIGVLDLVQRGEIIDYKTTSTTPNTDRVIHSTEIQTSAYALLYRHNTGQQENGIQLHHLVKLKNPKVVITTLPPMSPQQELRLMRQMEAYLEGLQSGRFVPSPGMHCSSCEFFHECRQWH